MYERITRLIFPYRYKTWTITTILKPGCCFLEKNSGSVKYNDQWCLLMNPDIYKISVQPDVIATGKSYRLKLLKYAARMQ